MIIPVKCFTCGKVIANKYRWFLAEIKKRKKPNDDDDQLDENETVYLSNTMTEKTISGQLLDELRLTRMCCRRHMLTHIDLD